MYLLSVISLFLLVFLSSTQVEAKSSAKCDDIVLTVMRAAKAVFTGKVVVLNGSRGSDREAVVQVKRVFRKPDLEDDNDASRRDAPDLAPGYKLHVAVPHVTSLLNDEFLVCLGIFSPLFALRERDTKLFIVRFQHQELEKSNRDNFVPKFELLTCPLPMSLTNLNRIAQAVKGKQNYTTQMMVVT